METKLKQRMIGAIVLTLRHRTDIKRQNVMAQMHRDPAKAIPPLHGALLKNEQDVMLFERLAFMARRGG